LAGPDRITRESRLGWSIPSKLNDSESHGYRGNGDSFSAGEAHNLARCSAEQARGEHHAQPGDRREHANHVGPAILQVKEQDEDRHVNDGLIEMKQEELRLVMGQDRKKDDLQGRDGCDISI
jgi:hypothetical protein